VAALGLGFGFGFGLGGAAPAAAAQPAPECTPAILNKSAVLGGVVKVSPLPGSRDASPETQISFLGLPSRDISDVSVIGTRSGAHSGRLLAYSQGDGASFLPSQPFIEGEWVKVHARIRVSRSSRTISDTFAIADQDSISSTPEPIHVGTAAEVQSFRSRPDLRPPVVTVTAHSPTASSDDIFVAPYTGPGQAGPMILDQNGAVVWFQPLPYNVFATNFRVQEYEGRPVLTWWQGDISVHGYGLGAGEIDDNAYTKLAQVNAGNGLKADLHEFQLTPRGTALITAYDPILCNLRSVGGSAHAGLTDAAFQEIDVKTGLVRYQWTSLDHVAISESYSAVSDRVEWPYDFFHMNSIDLEPEGNLLVSGRNTWTVYDVEGRSGQILWRLGGKHSSFAESEDARTAWQHDPRLLPDGTISIFDNGSFPTVHSQSRGVVLSLNGQNGTATLVTELTHGPPVIAESQGNLQALGDGNWFLGWGQYPEFSELGPEGQTLFDAQFPAFTQSYRSFRLAWTGTPLHRPAFAFKPAHAGSGEIYASWNGATALAAWRVLAGPTSGSLRAVAEAPRSGFETAIGVPPGTVGPDLEVEALDASGRPLGQSAVLAEAGLSGAVSAQPASEQAAAGRR